jgi:dihydrodipicolinate synthase/N-acetylneuraminate lyase
MPIIPYLRRSGYLRPDQLARMLDDGVAVGVKYALEPADPRADPDLDALLAEVPAAKVVSGIGELAAIPHMTAYSLCGFTAGAVCIDPRRSMRVLAALQMGDEARATDECAPLRPLEDLRSTHGPIPVIHSAVTASGIADMGAIAPMHSMPDAELTARIASAVAPLTEGVPA